MMVSYVDGVFRDVHGHLEWDQEEPQSGSCEVQLDAAKLWTGEDQRDEHLRGADFFDVKNYPSIKFVSTGIAVRSMTEFDVSGNLTIRGIEKTVTMHVGYVGGWETSYWQSKADEWRDLGPVRRIGFTGHFTLNRQDWEVSWQGDMKNGGVVVGDDIEVHINVEALNDEDVSRAEGKLVAWKAAS
jgi:polyisoprenoid-binding protein YceI